jgi:hypothetical protein
LKSTSCRSQVGTEPFCLSFQGYWFKRPTEVFARGAEILYVLLPYLTRLAFWECVIRCEETSWLQSCQIFLHTVPKRGKIYQILPNLPKFTKFAKIYQICQNLPNLSKFTKFVKIYQICQNLPNLSKFTKWQ